MVAGTEGRRREAEAELDPADSRSRGGSSPRQGSGRRRGDLLTLLADVLAAIPGKESNQALVDMLSGRARS